MAKKKAAEETFLTERHLDKIEIFVQKQQLVRYGLSELDFKMQLIRKDIELAKAAIKIKEQIIRDAQRTVPDYKDKIKELKENEKEFLLTVKEELDIKSERWGFDPDSGLVKEDDNEE